MIHLSDQSWQSQTWQECLYSAKISLSDLVHILKLDKIPAEWLAEPEFPLLAPLPYLSRIEPGNLNDPLLLQILPLTRELESQPGFSKDPLGELSVGPLRGVLHKYRGRVLIITTGACAINCRYCFRRHFPYASNQPDNLAWEQIFKYLANDSSIEEVILSGGDPLVLKDSRLAWLGAELAQISHLKRLRIHTRLPVVIPQRITPDLLAWTSATRLQMVMVIHSNHPAELDQFVAAGMGELKAAGITILNQSVLLAGINDSVTVLAELSKRLFEIGVLPYYLHLLDKVSGAGHFDTALADALDLYQQLQAQLPGYLLPKLVREEHGKAAKTLVTL
jgi:EF-P beta-lysylation protein EpmB